MELVPVFCCLFFISINSLVSLAFPTMVTLIEQNDNDKGSSKTMHIKYDFIVPIPDDVQKPYVTNNSTTSIEQLDGSTLFKNDTIITAKTKSGEIVWHLAITERKTNELLSVPKRSKELQIKLLPEKERRENLTNSPEEMDNKLMNEFFDDIDGLENLEHFDDNQLYEHQEPIINIDHNNNNDKQLYQHDIPIFDVNYTNDNYQELAEHEPEFVPFENEFNSDETYYARRNNHQQTIISNSSPVDLSADILVNQKLFEQGAELNPDAEIFSLDEYNHHRRSIRQQQEHRQHSTIDDIK